MGKARHAAAVRRFTEIPNVGPATAGDFETLGLRTPAELADCDADELHARLCRITGQRHDPCVIDVFTAAIAFMRGGPALPCWHYTAQRRARSES
jgi:hypothetical protein